jgi:hypothetical protein
VSKQLVKAIMGPCGTLINCMGDMSDGGKKGSRGRGMGRKEERKHEDNVEVGR